MPKRSSRIWEVSTERFLELVSNSTTITEVLSHFGLKNKGSNFKTLKKRLVEEKVDYSHIKTGVKPQKGTRFGGSVPIPLSEILVINSTFNRTHLKERLLKEGILENKCSICGQLPTWNGKPLSLQLDHINGTGDDNRVENLRMLCPHCHSQTENFAGKNKHRQDKI